MTAKRDEGVTFSLDAPYGTGKTFFLRRLFEQVQLRHPAAFIDAWADDTIDAPWAAIFSAIDDALAPHRSIIDSRIAKKLGDRSRKVMRSLLKSAAKKGSSLVIGDDGWDDVAEALADEAATTPVTDYRERKSAVSELRKSLSEVASSLDGPAFKAPIFIFVDELDRCRPTYAVNFLEEIKHLFNVPGVVFVFAMNKSQLSASISAVYGADFKSSDYLRRFVTKFYSLTPPDTYMLVRHHIERLGLDRLGYAAPKPPNSFSAVDFFVARSMAFWKVEPRDIIRVIDSLYTASTVWDSSFPIQLELFLPLVIMEVIGVSEDELLRRANSALDYRFPYGPTGNDDGFRGIKDVYVEFKKHSDKNFYFIQEDGRYRGPIERTIAKMLIDEFDARKPIDPNSTTLLSQYADLVHAIAVLTDDPEDEPVSLSPAVTV